MNIRRVIIKNVKFPAKNGRGANEFCHPLWADYSRLQNRLPPVTLKKNPEHGPCQPVLALTRALLSSQVFH
jgi:hypothetical protein